MKGQINIEFLAAAGLFVITLLGLITSGQVLPDYDDSMNRMELNLEADAATTEMLTEEGHHGFGAGGSEWEKNASTIANTEAFGLAKSHHVIDRAKLNSLKTVTVDGTAALNYTRFLNATDADNQYNFEFIWVPTVQTNNSYIKGSPPSDPNITEPGGESYRLADNRVHYGSVELNAAKYSFLVTSHNGVYDSLYVNSEDSDGWNFADPNPEEPYGIGEQLVENGFYVESFQNRDNDRGSMVILSKNIKEFGPSINTDTEVVTLTRYAVLDGEPLRVEVAAW